MEPFVWAQPHGKPGKKLIELSCTHCLCDGCASKMSDSGMRKCPICRHPHLLDPMILKMRSSAWRSAYAGWRSGAARGAVGEVVAIYSAETSTGRRADEGSLL
eukprot:956693-Prymnesium_polylepis.1